MTTHTNNYIYRHIEARNSTPPTLHDMKPTYEAHMKPTILSR